MSKSVSPYGTLDALCPRCRHQFKESFGRVEGEPVVICPKCGFHADPSAFRNAFQAAKKVLEEGLVIDIRDKLAEKPKDT